MCIICACDRAGDDFLTQFALALTAMEAATAAMLTCSESAVLPGTQEPDRERRARYDAAHKKMVRLSRDWNAIEQEREFMSERERRERRERWI